MLQSRPPNPCLLLAAYPPPSPRSASSRAAVSGQGSPLGSEPWQLKAGRKLGGGNKNNQEDPTQRGSLEPPGRRWLELELEQPGGKARPRPPAMRAWTGIPGVFPHRGRSPSRTTCRLPASCIGNDALCSTRLGVKIRLRARTDKGPRCYVCGDGASELSRVFLRGGLACHRTSKTQDSALRLKGALMSHFLPIAGIPAISLATCRHQALTVWEWKIHEWDSAFGLIR